MSRVGAVSLQQGHTRRFDNLNIINFWDDFNFLWPNFLANFIDHPTVQNNNLKINL